MFIVLPLAGQKPTDPHTVPLIFDLSTFMRMEASTTRRQQSGAYEKALSDTAIRGLAEPGNRIEVNVPLSELS
jgi:hypothetical protein